MEVTTVAAQGEAETKFNLAGFNLLVVANFNDVPHAKRALTAAVAELNFVLDTMKKTLNLEFVKNSVRSSSNVQEKNEWNRVTQVQESKGYDVSYSYSFQISDLDLVNQVYDTLTSLNVTSNPNVKLTVGSPSFAIKEATRERLNKRALKEAFQRVNERFEAECQVLGLEAAEFEVATWEVNYSDSRRSDKVANRVMAGKAAMSPTGGGRAHIEGSARGAAGGDIGGDVPTISFNTGLASVTVNLEVAFQRRNIVLAFSNQ